MARTLELEVMLVPRQDISWVKGLIDSKENVRKGTEIKPGYTLDDEKDEEKHLKTVKIFGEVE